MKVKSATALFTIYTILIFLLSGISYCVDAQHIKNNEKVILDEIKNALSESNLLSRIDDSFRLDTNFPDRVTVDILRYLVDSGFRMRTNNSNPSIQLRYTSANSLNQINRNTALRTIDGELTLFLLNEDSEISDTETLKINFSDEIGLNDINNLDTDWLATKFSEKTLNDRNLWQKVGQPSIIAVATGVTIFLLFNVRS